MFIAFSFMGSRGQTLVRSKRANTTRQKAPTASRAHCRFPGEASDSSTVPHPQVPCHHHHQVGIGQVGIGKALVVALQHTFLWPSCRQSPLTLGCLWSSPRGAAGLQHHPFLHPFPWLPPGLLEFESVVETPASSRFPRH